MKKHIIGSRGGTLVHHRTTTLLGVLCALLILSNLALVLYVNHLKQELEEAQKPQFTLLAPSVAWLSVEEFLAQQKTLSSSLEGLRGELEVVVDDTNGEVGVYVEDLTTGAWTGISEREAFVPASLLKIPILVATLEDAQEEEIDLDAVITLKESDLDPLFGTLHYLGAGYRISVRELLESMIIYSDNTAVNALRRSVVSDQEFIEVTLALGLPRPVEGMGVSPKQYSNALRSLYYSTHLRRPFSEAAISILLKTHFDDQLPAKLPPGTQVAHKIGVAYDDDTKRTGSYHDCGIVYLPEKPYIVCVMTSHLTEAEANEAISEISRITYEYMSASVENE